MGRAAKYNTIAERLTAQRQRKALYAYTEQYVPPGSQIGLVAEKSRQCRGRVARSRQNRAAYKKMQGRQGSAPLYIPRQPLGMATEPLPSSYLFREALRSPDALDESGLNHWDNAPPYAPPQTKGSDDSDQYMANLIDVMHGRRLRQARQWEDSRIACAEAGDVGRVLDSMQADLKEAMRNWKQFMRLRVIQRSAGWHGIVNVIQGNPVWRSIGCNGRPVQFTTYVRISER
jgi:hypothetical protein